MGIQELRGQHGDGKHNRSLAWKDGAKGAAECVITVSRSTWMILKINGVTTDLFCTGVIGHPIGMILNQGLKTLI